MTARIIGIGAYAPEQVVTNQDLTKFLDTNDAWIRERTGIGARHISTSEGTSALATEAAKRAIAARAFLRNGLRIFLTACFKGTERTMRTPTTAWESAFRYCNSIVKAHGGTMEARNTCLEAARSLQFRLPLEEE